MIIKKGNREFHLVSDNPTPSLQVWHLRSVGGKVWKGKYFKYRKCDTCGQMISCTTGAAIHYKMHERWKTLENQEPTDKKPAWAKNKVILRSVHLWVDNNFQQSGICEICSRPNDGSMVFDWSNKDHRYSRERKDWQYVCRSCHTKYDFQHNGRPPHGGRRKKTRMVEYEGKKQSLQFVLNSKSLEQYHVAICSRIHRGWTAARAIDTPIKEGTYKTKREGAEE